MPVIGRNVHCGIAVVIVRQPDGTAAYVPEWMIYPEAERLCLWIQPRLPLGCLRDLRDLLRAILGMLARQGDSEDGGSNVIASKPKGSISAGAVSCAHAPARVSRPDSRGLASVDTAPAAGSSAEGRQHHRKRDRP
jgi:hypothetical protein